MALPEYAWPPLPSTNPDKVTRDIAVALQRAWDVVEAERVAVLDLVESGAKRRALARLAEMQAAVEDFQRRVDVEADRFVSLITGQYAAGIEAAMTATGSSMTWTMSHRTVVASLASDSYDDLLARSVQAGRTTQAFARAVREAARESMPLQATAGKTARQVGRDLRRTLEERHRIGAVVYRDGSIHSPREYTEMVSRTKGRVAYNSGNVNGYYEAGVEYVEVFDGPTCGWATHRDADKANGSIRPLEAAAAYLVSHPNCVAAGTRVVPYGSVQAGYRAPYSGPMVTLRTARQHAVTVTPNHPVLTGRGWVAAHDVRVGDEVVSEAVGDSAEVRADLDDVPPRIEEVVDALRPAGASARTVAAPADFHGDARGFQGEVDVVDADGALRDDVDPAGPERVEQGHLGRGGAGAAGLAGGGARLARSDGVGLSAPGGVRGSGGGRVVAAVAQGHAGGPEPLADQRVADAGVAGEANRWLPRPVALDQVVEVRDHGLWTGHVYDLTTAGAAYLAGSILVHNCRRSFGPRPDIRSAKGAQNAEPLQDMTAHVDEAHNEALSPRGSASSERRERLMERRAARAAG